MKTTEPNPNPALMTFTVKKPDRRRKTGERTWTEEFECPTPEAADSKAIQLLIANTAKSVTYTPTWVVRKSAMNGAEYWEKIGTPACCSPSTETYWSM